MKSKSSRSIDYYMSLNYPFTVEQFNEHDGTVRFGMEVPDLPGLVADGATMEEAYASLLENKKMWLDIALQKGMPIPEPISDDQFSGRFLLRVSSRMHRTLCEQAKRHNMSMNQYVRMLIEKQISNREIVAALGEIKTAINEVPDKISANVQRKCVATWAAAGGHSINLTFPTSGQSGAGGQFRIAPKRSLAYRGES